LAPRLLHLRGRMKKIVFLIAVVVLGFVARQKNAEKNREKLIGTWKMEQTLPGGVLARGHVTFKPDGNFYTTVDAAKDGRMGFAEAGGKWEMSGSTFKMNFTRKTIPGVDLDQLYGGSIVKVDDKTLTYKSRNGAETWQRVQ
jgi:hypothetical protein